MMKRITLVLMGIGALVFGVTTKATDESDEEHRKLIERKIQATDGASENVDRDEQPHVTTLHHQMPLLARKAAIPSRKTLALYGDAFAYEKTIQSGFFVDNIKVQIQKQNADGTFWVRESLKSDSEGKFQGLIKSSGSFRLRIVEKEKLYEESGSSYAIVPSAEYGNRKLTFDNNGYSPVFKAAKGDSVFVRANLVEKNFVLSGAVWEDENRNGIWDEGEPAITDALVVLTRKDEGKKTVTVGTRITDGSGRYEFIKKAKNSVYTLQVIPSSEFGFTLRLEAAHNTLEIDSDVDFDGRLRGFQVSGGQVMNVNAGVVEKKYLSRVKGVVWRDRGDGKRNEDRRIKGATVTLRRFSGYPDSTATTRKDGTFEIWLLPTPSSEVYSVGITKHGYVPTKQLNPDDFTESKKDSDIDEDGNSDSFHMDTAGQVVRIDAGLAKSQAAPPRVQTVDCTNSTVSLAPVDEDNMFEIRDFTPDAINAFSFSKAALKQGITVTQTPDAGTVIVGPGNTFNVTVSAVAGRTTIQCDVEFETVDLTAPSIEIFGVEDRGYYLKDNLPVISATAVDNVDGILPVDIQIDSKPYEPSEEIPTGLHSVEAIATDTAGNTASTEIIIVVGNIPVFTPVVESSVLECSSGKFESLEIVLSSKEVDVDSILLASTFLWISMDGSELNEEPLAVDDSSFREIGRQVRFVASGEELACPDYADVVGTGREPEVFDFTVSLPELQAATIRRGLQSSDGPTFSPSTSATRSPTRSPTDGSPTISTLEPTPTNVSTSPSESPSEYPTDQPTNTAPTVYPTPNGTSYAPSPSPSATTSPAPTSEPKVCRWTQYITGNKKGRVRTPGDSKSRASCKMGPQDATAKAFSVNGVIAAQGNAIDYCFGAAGAANTASSSLVYHIHLIEGTVEYCDPTIDCNSNAPGFTMRTNVIKRGITTSFGSHSHVGGFIGVISPCATTSAIGAIKYGPFKPTWLDVKLGDVTLPVPYEEVNPGPDARSPQTSRTGTNGQPLNPTLKGKTHIKYNIDSRVDVNVKADSGISWFVISSVRVTAKLSEATLGIDGEASCGQYPDRCVDGVLKYNYKGEEIPK